MSMKETPRGSDENLTASTDSFWDVGNYKRTVKRVDDGSKLCDELMKLVTERAEIEAKYASKLKAWAKKWEDTIRYGPEYGYMEESMRGTVQEANARANVHTKCRDDLMADVLDLVKKWKGDNYQKSMFQWKRTKEAEEGFSKAQKPWAKLLMKVMRSKKAFHASSKATEQALKLQHEIDSDANVPPEKLKKLDENVDKTNKEMQRCETKYKERLDTITQYNPKYEQEMIEQFQKCQEFEEKRLDFFKEALMKYHKCIDVSQLPEFSGIFMQMMTTFQMSDSQRDLDWWSRNHGVAMPQNWPVFEEWQPPKHINKRQKSTSQRLSIMRPYAPESFQEFGIRYLDDLRRKDQDSNTDTDASNNNQGMTTDGTQRKTSALVIGSGATGVVSGEQIHQETTANSKRTFRVLDKVRSNLGTKRQGKTSALVISSGATGVLSGEQTYQETTANSKRTFRVLDKIRSNLETKRSRQGKTSALVIGSGTTGVVSGEQARQETTANSKRTFRVLDKVRSNLETNRQGKTSALVIGSGATGVLSGEQAHKETTANSKRTFRVLDKVRLNLGTKSQKQPKSGNIVSEMSGSPVSDDQGGSHLYCMIPDNLLSQRSPDSDLTSSLPGRLEYCNGANFLDRTEQDRRQTHDENNLGPKQNNSPNAYISDNDQPPFNPSYSMDYDQPSSMDYDQKSPVVYSQPSTTEHPQSALTFNHVGSKEVSKPYIEEQNPFRYQGSPEHQPGPNEWSNQLPPIDNDIGVPVRALYDYNSMEGDELTFKTGEILTKLSEVDDQGWCEGRFQGQYGLFPAEYVETV